MTPVPRVLVVRTGLGPCCLALGSVVETMRPLPVEPIPGSPAAVLGASVLRGRPTPVVSLERILEKGDPAPPGRFVLLRVGERRVALAVTEVLGFADADRLDLAVLPPLLASADPGFLAAAGTLDGEFVALLEPARLVPPEVWRTLEDSA